MFNTYYENYQKNYNENNIKEKLNIEKETYRSGAKLFGETKTSIIDKLAKL